MTPATNRQKKILNFFNIRHSPNITVGAAGYEIDALLSHPPFKEKWSRYLYLTKDFDNTSDELMPFDEKELEEVEVPENWDSSEEVEKFRAELAAKIIADESPFDSPQPAIEFKKKVFVFTGKFDFGSRKQCVAAIEERGGVFARGGMSGNVDYLVIGTKGNPAWKRGAYGNKIERAIIIRREAGKPAIISEDHWRTFL